MRHFLYSLFFVSALTVFAESTEENYTVETDAGRVEVKHVYLNTDYKEKYDTLKAEWDANVAKWKDRIAAAEAKADLDHQEYQKIAEVLGTRNWTSNSTENLKSKAIRQVREVYPSQASLAEYAFIFQNFPSDPPEGLSDRSFYGRELIENSWVAVGMTEDEVMTVFGSPDGSEAKPDSKTLSYAMRPSEDRFLVFEFKDGLLTRVITLNSDSQKFVQHLPRQTRSD